MNRGYCECGRDTRIDHNHCIAHSGVECFGCLRSELAKAHAKLNTPELHDFAKAVALEAAHQRERWGSDHDAGKTPADWLWLTAHLAGKALHAVVEGRTEKALQHVITTAAVLANWHAAIEGTHTRMRPGIEPPKEVA